MPAPLPTFGFSEPAARRAWTGLALALLGLAVLPLGALLAVPGAARHALVLHAGVAGVLLPLCLLGRLGTGVPSWRESLLWLSLAGAAGGLLAMCLSGAGQPLLLSFFPLLRGTPQPALLIAPPAIAVITLLLRRRAPGPAPADAGLAWLALPLVVALTTLAWGWTASADVAPHVREELVAWGSGHAWLLVLAGLSLRGWLQLAEVSGAGAVGWARLFALTTAGLLLAPASLPIDSAEYLRTINRLALALCALVPAGLAVALLRDPVRRAVGGAWLIAAIAIYFAALLAAAWLLFAAGHAASRNGPLLLQHGLGLAAVVALWGAQRRSPDRFSRPVSATAPASPIAPGAWRLAAVLVAGGLVLALALDPPQRAPLDPASRQHALDRRQPEIAERFRQGVAMMQLRRYDDAATAFHRVLALDPAIPEAHVNLGFALYETGQHAAAQRFFEAATRLNKDQLNAYYGLALSARAQGANAVAAGAMRTWLHLAPPDDPFRGRAEALFDAAAADLRAARPTSPASP